MRRAVVQPWLSLDQPHPDVWILLALGLFFYAFSFFALGSNSACLTDRTRQQKHCDVVSLCCSGQKVDGVTVALVQFLSDSLSHF